MSAVAKSVGLVVLFAFSIIVALVAVSIYGLIVTTLLFIAVAVGLGFVVLVMTQFSLLQNINAMPLDAVAGFGLAANLLMIALLSISTLATFIVCPSKIRKNAAVADSLPASENWDVVRKAIAEVSKRLAVPEFRYIAPASAGFIGSLKLGKMKVLCIDPTLARWLQYNELCAVIAHEYGHFGKGLSFSYSFIRRCMVSADFLRNEVNEGGRRTVYQWVILAVTWPFPIPFIRSLFRKVFFHLATTVAAFYDFVTRRLAALFSREFYRAEFTADEVAYEAYGHTFIDGLTKIAAIEFIFKCKSLKQGLRNSEIQKMWAEFCNSGFVTHPPLAIRQSRLMRQSDAADNQSVISEVMAILDAEPFDPEQFAPAELVQRLSFSQVDVRQKSAF